MRSRTLVQVSARPSPGVGASTTLVLVLKPPAEPPVPKSVLVASHAPKPAVRPAVVLPSSATDACRPQDLADGYAVQARLATLAGSPQVGWKIAATSVGGQTHIGVDGPLAGRLFADRVFADGARVSVAGNHMRVAEAEFAFRMARDLPPRPTPYSVAEVMDAVTGLHPAIELPDSRFADFARAGGPQLAADDACAFAFVLGAAAQDDWRETDLARSGVRLLVGGAEVTAGRGQDALGDPRTALTWLANNHAAQGAGLCAGQIVTTGVCGLPWPIAPGDDVCADFGLLGEVRVELTDGG